MDPEPHRNPQPVRPSNPIKPNGAARRTFARYANWTVGLAAALLVLISAAGYFHHREQLADIATEHLRLIVTGPSSLQDGVAAEYTVSTTAIDGRALHAEIEVALLDPNGERLKAFRKTADENGRLKVVIPADATALFVVDVDHTIQFAAQHLSGKQLDVNRLPFLGIEDVVIDIFILNDSADGDGAVAKRRRILWRCNAAFRAVVSNRCQRHCPS